MLKQMGHIVTVGLLRINVISCVIDKQIRTINTDHTIQLAAQIII
jgi:hypothetical protein